MAIVTREFDYEVDGKLFDGAVAVDDTQSGRRPAVMVYHGWEGRSDSQLNFACSLASLGYLGFACDLFGKGIRGDVTGDNSALIAPFVQDRAMLRARLIGAVEVVRSMPEVDTSKIAAIGFCFGGLCVLDLARSGIDVQAVASFHGLFIRPEGLPTPPIKAKVIAFHGWDDPMVPPTEAVALGKELTEAGADWQIHAYGGTMHAFMAVGANQPEAGIQYNERSARRAWTSLVAFLSEAFSN
ncbi:MAG: dienelactone hydrolase family protein [Blastocatellia bacterium]|nr:dienelactone hydrolase family protein [Blastocatellia bacterium]MBO0800235.1 dienelactone hydrolase family protein [Blastocatellia bacterium]